MIGQFQTYSFASVFDCFHASFYGRTSVDVPWRFLHFADVEQSILADTYIDEGTKRSHIRNLS